MVGKMQFSRKRLSHIVEKHRRGSFKFEILVFPNGNMEKMGGEPLDEMKKNEKCQKNLRSHIIFRIR